MQSVRVFRWILIALSALLAVFLIARGSVIVGVIIGGMAVTRAALFLRMQHRRDQFHERLSARRVAYRNRVGRNGLGDRSQ